MIVRVNTGSQRGFTFQEHIFINNSNISSSKHCHTMINTLITHYILCKDLIIQKYHSITQKEFRSQTHDTKYT